MSDTEILDWLEKNMVFRETLKSVEEIGHTRQPEGCVYFIWKPPMQTLREAVQNENERTRR